MHWGDSNTGLNTVIGETLGETEVTLTTNQMPQHSHTIYAASGGTASGEERGTQSERHELSFAIGRRVHLSTGAGDAGHAV